MANELLLETLESADNIAKCLENIEALLSEVRRVFGRTVVRMEGTALAFESAWRKIVANVSQGQTLEMQATRPGLLCDFEKRLDLLKNTHALLAWLSNRGRTDLPNSDLLLQDIADMQRLKSRVFDRWQSVDDLERLAVEHYPLAQAHLETIAATHAPPAEWYQGEEEHLLEE